MNETKDNNAVVQGEVPKWEPGPSPYGNRAQRRAHEAIQRKKTPDRIQVFNDLMRDKYIETQAKELVQLHPTKGFRLYGEQRMMAGIEGQSGMWHTITNGIKKAQKHYAKTYG